MSFLVFLVPILSLWEAVKKYRILVSFLLFVFSELVSYLINVLLSSTESASYLHCSHSLLHCLFFSAFLFFFASSPIQRFLPTFFVSLPSLRDSTDLVSESPAIRAVRTVESSNSSNWLAARRAAKASYGSNDAPFVRIPRCIDSFGVWNRFFDPPSASSFNAISSSSSFRPSLCFSFLNPFYSSLLNAKSGRRLQLELSSSKSSAAFYSYPLNNPSSSSYSPWNKNSTSSSSSNNSSAFSSLSKSLSSSSSNNPSPNSNSTTKKTNPPSLNNIDLRQCVYTNQIDVFFLKTWGNPYFFGLSGIQVIDVDGSAIPVSLSRSCLSVFNNKSWILLSGKDLSSLFLPPFVTLEPSSMFRFFVFPNSYCPHLTVSPRSLSRM